MPEQRSDEWRSTWWERRPGWQRGLLMVLIAAGTSLFSSLPGCLLV